MGLTRNIFLWGSRSRQLRSILPRFGFFRKAVSRFMPGEHLDDALIAASELGGNGIAAVLTYLGENVTDTAEAKQVANHYCDVLDRISEKKLDCHISVKLTQLGLDLGPDQTILNLRSIVEHALRTRNFVWIDMEGTQYTDVTVDIYRRARSEFPNVGLCLQSYLHRTANDLTSLIPLSPSIRLVKGAYAEPRAIAYQKKKQVDENFLSLATQLLTVAKTNGSLPAIASHDLRLIRHIQEETRALDISRSTCEFQMLYGIKTQEQLRLVRDGYRVRVLISYGTFWFPWYMRRLAERPANVLFVLRNIFAR